MKKLLSALLFLLLLLYAVIIYLPKTELYYLIESQLSPFKITVDSEEVDENLFGFTIRGGDIYYQDIKAFKNSELTVTTLLFYNTIHASNLQVGEDLNTFLPPAIENLRITQHLFLPHIVSLSANGDFGEASGEANLLERKVVIDLQLAGEVTRKYRSLLQYLKKTEEGYRYESSF